MNENSDFYIPSCDEFRRGYEAFNLKEKKGPIYFEATALISQSWGNSAGMAGGVSKIIRGWNRFYANFDFDGLVNCIDSNLPAFEQFRSRDISSLSENDTEIIKDVFNQFLNALRRTSDNVKSAVSVAKAFGVLAPNFLPIWDSNIAYAYKCSYLPEIADSPYVRFCKPMKIMAEKLKGCVPNPDDRSLLKRIDEYNYSKYTMHWI